MFRDPFNDVEDQQDEKDRDQDPSQADQSEQGGFFSVENVNQDDPNGENQD
jgi:hypothetical protein